MWFWDSRQYRTRGRVVLRDVEEEIYGNFNWRQPLQSLTEEEVIPQTDPNAAS